MQQYNLQQYLLLITMFRSQNMGYYQIVIPRESAWEIMNALGQVDSVHIIESKVLGIKPFSMQVKRCDEALQRISSLEETLTALDINTHKIKRDREEYTRLFKYWTEKSYENKQHATSMLDDYDNQITKLWTNYNEINKRIESVTAKQISSEEYVAVLKAADKVLGQNFYNSENKATNLSYKCGIIRKEEQQRFQKMVFRASRGNAYMNLIPMEDVYSGDIVELRSKVIFFILYPARESSYLESKLDRLVISYAAVEFKLPKSIQAKNNEIAHHQKNIIQYRSLLVLNKEEKQAFMSKLTQLATNEHSVTQIEFLKVFMLKERQIYHQLNQMELFNNFIKGRIYIPDQQFDRVHKVLAKIEKVDTPTAQIIKHSATKFPTHFKINDFTASAQQIVETYGIPRYKQANPGLFTCITFPFLFGVMFGDIMHGAILFGFGLMLMFNKKQYSAHNLLSYLIPHRYLIALMGFFSCYCGFIYNDYLSISLNLFGSCYVPNNVQVGADIPRTSLDCVYPFGLDPVWSISSNGLTYVNSMKMKIAVIIGVVHMSAAVCIKALNAIHFRKWMDLFCEFVPQIGFMVLLFGYMDFLIVYKWNVNWENNTAAAPSIITTMINLPLGLGQTQNCCGAEPMWGTYQDTSQNQIQLAFLVTSLLCIPWMLLPKPLVEIYCGNHHQKDIRQNQSLLSEDQLADELSKRSSNDIEEPEEHSNDQIFVHQMIETIEYVLGCISNTASYLRLWALSLAHSQLAQVFFNKTVQQPIVEGYKGIPMMVINFVMLAMSTFGVLLCMDVMECFLHALRLHWVQFQNKFYKADGFSFQPYSFKKNVLLAVEV